MHNSKALRIKPGSTVRLNSIDPGFHGKYASEAEAADHVATNLARITELQRKLYADQGHALLIVLQGIDSAGKDGTCWHVISAMDPQGVAVQGFKEPTQEELSHHFLWRIDPHSPARGRVAIFNRSHYEDVLIARVHKLVPNKVLQERYAFINDWERLLTQQNNTTILKFFLHISKEEQLARFRERLQNPAHQWKISEADYTERERWDEYVDAFETALTRCSTSHAPWYVIPSNHKWFRNLAISQIIADTLEGMNLELPKPTVNIADISRRYHSEVAAADDKKKTPKSGKSKKNRKPA